MRRLPKGSTFLKPVLAVLLLVALWQVTSWIASGWPSPWKVGTALWSDFCQPEFRAALSGSGRRMVIGYLLVMILGVAGGMVLGRIPLVDQILGSFAVAVHAIPGAAWVPLSIIWFGMTERAVVFTIVLGAVGIVIAPIAAETNLLWSCRRDRAGVYGTPCDASEKTAVISSYFTLASGFIFG